MKLRYETKNLILAIGNEAFADKINDYLIRNREDFSKWDLKLNDSYFTMEYQLRAVQAEQRIFLKGEGARYYLFKKENLYRVIGNISFGLSEKEVDGHCVLGYKIDSSERCKGYAYEAASYLIPIFAKEHRIDSIYAEILPENRPSLILAEKLGFAFDKVIRNAHEFGGQDRDILQYVLRI